MGRRKEDGGRGRGGENTPNKNLSFFPNIFDNNKEIKAKSA